LFDYLVVVAECLDIGRMQRDRATIDEIAARFRDSAYYFEFVGSETYGIKLGRVTRQRFSLAVNQSLF